MPHITVGLTSTCVALLAAQPEDATLRDKLPKVIPFYLAGRAAQIGGWPYPEFRRDDGHGPTDLFEVDVDEGTLTTFEAEAERQGVSVEQLFEHAALYLAAAYDVSAESDR